jgi:hypothetical protein
MVRQTSHLRWRAAVAATVAILAGAACGSESSPAAEGPLRSASAEVSSPTVQAIPGVTPPAQVWIAVFPPSSDWLIPQAMSLEVGNEAWHVGPPENGGVISPILGDFTPVTLFGTDDCHVYASFVAAPGGFYFIRFAEDASTSVEQVDGLDAGPGLGERPLSDCE